MLGLLPESQEVNRAALVRLVAASPLGLFAMKAMPSVAPVENALSKNPTAIAVGEYNGPRMVEVYAEGIHPETGFPAYESIGRIAEPSLETGAQTFAASVRALPELAEKLAEKPYLSRLTTSWFRREPDMGWMQWHAPVDPDALPLGWTKDFTGFQFEPMPK